MAKIKQRHIYGRSLLVLSQKHIFFSPTPRLPQIHEKLFPLHDRKEMKMSTFNPMKNQAENTAPRSRMPKFWWALASPLHFVWTFRMSFRLFSTVRMTNERTVRTGHLSMSLLILLSLKSYRQQWDIYIRVCVCMHVSQSAHIHPKCIDSHLTLANFCTYVRDVISSMNTILHVCLYKHMHSIMIILFCQKRIEQPKIVSIQISPSPESYYIKRNVWIPQGTAPGPRKVLVQGAH